MGLMYRVNFNYLLTCIWVFKEKLSFGQMTFINDFLTKKSESH